MSAQPQEAPEVEEVEGQPASRVGRYPWPMKRGNFIVVPKAEGRSALSAGRHHAKRHGTGARYQMRQTDDGNTIIRRIDEEPAVEAD